MDSYPRDFDYFSFQKQKVHDSSADLWYTEDDLSECSLLPSPLSEYNSQTHGHLGEWDLPLGSSFDTNQTIPSHLCYQTEIWSFIDGQSLDDSAEIATEPLALDRNNA